MSGKYWLCCRSTDPLAHDKICIQKKCGHPEKCVYGTSEEHCRRAGLARCDPTPSRIGTVRFALVNGTELPCVKVASDLCIIANAVKHLPSDHQLREPHIFIHELTARE